MQPTGFFQDFAGVRADDREGNHARHPGKEVKMRSSAPDYKEDVISKPENEQHLFTIGAKY